MTSQNPSTPNVVMIVVDDLDVDTFQRLLDAGLLPNVRRLIVNRGTNFTNAYVPCSICAPSRASLLTGRYTHNHGTWHVTGDEGPERFDNYLVQSSNAYLPMWIGDNYYRAFVGKWHLGERRPGWNFYRLIESYDPRPGMYKVSEGGTPVLPPVYQTKYVGDQSLRAIQQSGNRPLFLLVAPRAIHVSTPSWRKLDSYAKATFTGAPVAFAQFWNESANMWRQHLVTVEYVAGDPRHLWWSRDSAKRDSGWGEWANTGNDATVAAGTGAGFVVGWNVLTPNPTTKRQQMLKALGSEIRFFTRDIVNGVEGPWQLTGDQSILAGTGTLAVADWTAISLPNGVVRQQVVRGNEIDGYTSYVRQKVDGQDFSAWMPDPDWGETVVFGSVRGFNIIPTSGARYVAQVVQLPPEATRFEWWQSPELVDYRVLAETGNDPSSLGGPTKIRGGEEEEQLTGRAMQFDGEPVGMRRTYVDDPGRLDPLEPLTQTHPYYLMRAFAEGSWWPVAPGQTYEWGGDYPAGRLRAGHDPHGFTPLDDRYDLPTGKLSYNLPLESTLPYYSAQAWPDLNTQVPGNRRQEDYLRRLALDRMEQMLSFDRMVGDVLAAAGSNTVIVFTSDNGHYNGEHRLSNKIAPHEESVRVPLFIVAPGAAPRAVAQLVANIDIAPTVLDFLGRPWEDAGFGIDGRSLRPLVEQGGVLSWRQSLLLEHHKPRGTAYPPSDWRFGLPDYLGLRVAANAGGSRANSAYFQYYLSLDDRDSAFTYEHYALNVDPFQIDNLATGRIPALDAFLRDYYAAAGAQCRVQDQKPVP